MPAGRQQSENEKSDGPERKDRAGRRDSPYFFSKRREKHAEDEKKTAASTKKLMMGSDRAKAAHVSEQPSKYSTAQPHTAKAGAEANEATTSHFTRRVCQTSWFSAITRWYQSALSLGVRFCVLKSL